MSAVTETAPEVSVPAVEDTRRVRVTAVRDLADGVRELELTASEPLPSWAPGAHVDLHLGDELVRQYSLCGDPDDLDRYRVAVLHEPEGRGGSRRVHELRPGATLLLGGPRNHFAFEAAASYVFVAGGIGITPLRPMIAAAEAAGAHWTLLYGGRSRASMAYAEELAGYGDRVRIRPQDEHGLLDLTEVLEPARADTLVYCCGPEPLLRAVEQATASWPAGALRVERFAPREETDDTNDTAFEVVFSRSGVTAQVPPGTSILDVAAEHAIFVPRSCAEGVCGTCETLVLDGVPDHRDSVYTPEDHAEGAFAPCVSRCSSARLVLDL